MSYSRLGLSIAIKNSKNFRRLCYSPCDQNPPQQPHFGADARLGTRRPPEAQIMVRHGAGHHGGCRHSVGSCARVFAECVAGPGLRRCSPSSERSRGAFSALEKCNTCPAPASLSLPGCPAAIAHRRKWCQDLCREAAPALWRYFLGANSGARVCSCCCSQRWVCCFFVRPGWCAAAIPGLAEQVAGTVGGG
eukprot:COSAG01_NODE_6396_length_3689_cov_1.935376_8_plen_192_part_00